MIAKGVKGGSPSHPTEKGGCSHETKGGLPCEGKIQRHSCSNMLILIQSHEGGSVIFRPQKGGSGVNREEGNSVWSKKRSGRSQPRKKQRARSKCRRILRFGRLASLKSQSAGVRHKKREKKVFLKK